MRPGGASGGFSQGRVGQGPPRGAFRGGLPRGASAPNGLGAPEKRRAVPVAPGGRSSRTRGVTGPAGLGRGRRGVCWQNEEATAAWPKEQPGLGGRFGSWGPSGGGAADLPGRGCVLLLGGRAAVGPRPADAIQGRDAGELRARGLAGTPCV